MSSIDEGSVNANSSVRNHVENTFSDLNMDLLKQVSSTRVN